MIQNFNVKDMNSTMNIVTVKHLLRYGSIRKPALASGWNSLDWRGDIMSFETQQAEVVFLNRIGKEELAKVLAELIKDSRELRRAILEVVWNCPNIVTQI